MNSAQAARTAQLLLAARDARQACAPLPDGFRPHDETEGYAVQDALIARAGLPVAGFKIGATSKKAQDLLGLDGPFSGRILAAGVHQSPAELSAGDFIFRLVEPEFAFRLSAPLPPRRTAYRETEVAEAVASLHPAVEVVNSAYGDDWTKAGAPALIADNGVHGAFVLGPAHSDWQSLDLVNHAVTLSRNGEQVGQGVGGNALGGPLTALTWLVNQQRDFGRALQAGTIVTTGVVTDFVLVKAGDCIEADYGEMGRVELRFTD